MSKRTEILRYLRNLLTDAELFDGSVYTSEDKAYTMEELPCALILISKERQEVYSESRPRVIKKIAEVTLQLIAEHCEDAEEELHDLFSEIEGLILGDDTLGDIVSRLMPDSLEFFSYMEAERPILSGIMKFEVTYFEEMAVKEDLPNLNIESRIKLKEELKNGIHANR